jgi:hypothetical protein
MEADAALVRLLRDLEERLLRSDVRRSPTALGDLLADDFVEFGSSGRVSTSSRSSMRYIKSRRGVHAQSWISAQASSDPGLCWPRTGFRVGRRGLSALATEFDLETCRGALADDFSPGNAVPSAVMSTPSRSRCRIPQRRVEIERRTAELDARAVEAVPGKNLERCATRDARALELPNARSALRAAADPECSPGGTESMCPRAEGRFTPLRLAPVVPPTHAAWGQRAR